jgi:formate hydrogenlyase subunit 3/multisubunit Na+/H+ antiporter MnhD subunit
MSSIGLPGTNGFVSEFLSILGAFTSTHLGMAFAIPAALGVILGAVYMLHMAARVIFGPLKTPHVDHHGSEPQEYHLPTDLSLREIFVLVPIAVLVIVLGVWPTPLLNSILSPVQLTRETLTERTSNWGTPTALAPSPGTAGEGRSEGASSFIVHRSTLKTTLSLPLPSSTPLTAGLSTRGGKNTSLGAVQLSLAITESK